MLLRARVALNQLISEAKRNNIYDPFTLEFIDKKSCETFSEWKDKFLSYCDVEEQFNDLMIAKHYIGMYSVDSEEELKRRFQLSIDRSFESVKKNEYPRFHIQYMKLIDEMLMKISPQQWKILEDRYQTIVPQQSKWFDWSTPKNSARLQDLNFSGVFNYLKERFVEIALCDYPIINSLSGWNPNFLHYRTLLQEAMVGCKMLPQPI